MKDDIGYLDGYLYRDCIFIRLLDGKIFYLNSLVGLTIIK